MDIVALVEKNKDWNKLAILLAVVVAATAADIVAVGKDALADIVAVAAYIVADKAGYNNNQEFFLLAAQNIALAAGLYNKQKEPCPQMNIQIATKPISIVANLYFSFSVNNIPLVEHIQSRYRYQGFARKAAENHKDWNSFANQEPRNMDYYILADNIVVAALFFAAAKRLLCDIFYHHHLRIASK